MVTKTILNSIRFQFSWIDKEKKKNPQLPKMKKALSPSIFDLQSNCGTERLFFKEKLAKLDHSGFWHERRKGI